MVFDSTNAHLVTCADRTMLLHVPTTALFELDDLAVKVRTTVRERQVADAAELAAILHPQFEARDVCAFVEKMQQLSVLHGSAEHQPINPGRIQVNSYPLSTIVLNVNTGCNLGCRYCYKEDLAVPAKGQRMSPEVAKRSIELLLRQAEGRERVGVVFFGGEPLTNMPLIREVVAYCERRVSETGIDVDFSLTTNATLLNRELIEWFDAHRFGISISIDGPRAIHDRNRRTVGGGATYAVVSRKARELLDRYRSRAVGARVTLTSGTTEVEAIHAHLRDELGFHEVGYAPVTASDQQGHALSEAELNSVYAGFERLGQAYLRAALRGGNTGFSNLHQLMTDLHEGRRKALPCGAGVGMLAVDYKGDLNLCHRFTGSQMPTFGNVSDGIESPRLAQFLERGADRTGTHCQTCRIRNLCAGGCYHESWVRYADPHHRTYHYCELLRRWVDFGIGVYSEIVARNPGYFSIHIEPRRAIA